MSKHIRNQMAQDSDSNAWSQPRGPAVRRIERGLTGMDPLGAQQEAAFAEGLFIRNLLTGRLRSDMLWVLALMTLVGVCLLIPLALSAVEWLSRVALSAPLLLVLVVTITGVLFLVNVGLSVSERRSHRHDR